MKKQLPDLRPQFTKALINFGEREKGRPLRQKEFDPTVSPSQINNVASGRSVNHRLRARIEAFIEKWSEPQEEEE